jgi:hypothetical protein
MGVLQRSRANSRQPYWMSVAPIFKGQLGCMIEQIWILIFAVATPIAGFIGFAIQLRTVHKVRLENEKLALEIRRLQMELQKADNRITKATDDEIEKYSGARFSRRFRGPCPGDEGTDQEKISFRHTVGIFLLLAAIALFIFYLIFDIYRVAQWLWSAFLS